MKLRAFFDAGSGVVLWAGDDASRARWASAVDLADLGLPEELQREAEAIAARYDALFDWSDPAGADPLGRPEGPGLLADARTWLARVRGALGPGCEVSDGFVRR